jgi:Pin2-interacting protein X1
MPPKKAQTKAARGLDVNEFAATGPSEWSRRMLERSGWREGKGLGKDESGAVTHVRVKKKDDTLALGYVKPVADAPPAWWSVDPFKAASAAAGGSGGGGGAAAARSDDAAAADGLPGVPAGVDVQDFYAKLFEATGGARLGMRARRDQPGKVKRAEAAGGAAAAASSAADTLGESGDDAEERRRERKRARRREREARAEEEAAPVETVREESEADRAARKAARREAKKAARA